MKHVGTLVLALAVLFLATSVANRCHSTAHISTVNVAQQSLNQDLTAPDKALHPEPFLTDVCVGIGLLILLVSRKYSLILKQKRSWIKDPYKHFGPIFARPRELFFPLSLSQLGVSRT